MTRYRCEAGATHHAKPKFFHCAKLGTLREVRAYRYQGQYGLNERILVKGSHGSARFGALCWGYNGQGPHGLRDLLLFLGLHQELADKVAFTSFRGHAPGTDWSLTFHNRSVTYANGHEPPKTYAGYMVENPPLALVS